MASATTTRGYQSIWRDESAKASDPFRPAPIVVIDTPLHNKRQDVSLLRLLELLLADGT